MSRNKILLSHGDRLGIKEPQTIQQAETYLRVLNTKSVANTISDTAKIVFCLNLAAVRCNDTFDKNDALKLAGLRKPQYHNHLNNVEKMLNLDKPLSIAELCVQFDCTEAKELAENILKKYQQSDVKIKDIQHPQYVAAAVYTSCKLNGVKIDKTSLKVLSRLKTNQWNELLEEFFNFTKSLGLAKGKKKDNKKMESFEEDQNQGEITQKAKEKENFIEDYEVWKERILEEATAAILQLE